MKNTSAVDTNLDAITKYMSLSNSPKGLQHSPITSNFKLVIFHVSLGPLCGGRIGQAKTISFGSTLCCTCRLLSYLEIGSHRLIHCLRTQSFTSGLTNVIVGVLKSVFSLAVRSGFYCKDSGGISKH